jgi:RHS repeat-associated protein
VSSADLSVTAPGLSSNTATYYPTTGQKHQETIGLTGRATTTCDYTYNASGRLVSASNGASTLAFDYDAAGQILKSGSTTFAYAAGRLVSATDQHGTTTFTYDRNRRRRVTSPSTVITYTWDAADRLSAVTTDRNGDGQAETAATHTYDAAGQRQRSVITSGGVTTTTDFTYDGISLLSLASTTGTATTQLTYLRDELDHPRAVVVDAPELASPVTLALATTMRGDVVAMTDGAGGSLATWSYDPYGKPLSSTVTTTALLPDLALVSRIARLQVLRYAGYAYDEPSGLYYLSQRYYDPATCQFISRDPVGADGEESAYQYCGGDPVGKVDPSGPSSRVSSSSGRAGILDPHPHPVIPSVRQAV